ncbi:MAG: sigma-70 family RNA polymerase sigma factor [Oscillospiraceae bacterium]|nr:sigma-70 family RNA polymerase sigma factor [Oscillospiraceae bacterium]
MLIYTQMLDTPEDRSKFELIYRMYRGLMFHVANRILNNEHDAEDAVQQAFFAVLKNLDKFSEAGCPKSKSLIVTIVERKAIDLYRVKQRQAAVPLEEEYINVPSASEVDAIPDRTVLAKAMAMLPTRYRELLFLKYDNGYSEREIAAMCSMTEANVNKTIQRAKKKLESILEEQEA